MTNALVCPAMPTTARNSPYWASVIPFARAAAVESEPDANLPPMPPGEHVVEDYRHLSLSLKAHPVSFLRALLNGRGIVKNGTLGAGQPRVSIAGLVIVRQRPGTAKGVIFMTLEDETGVANVIVWPKVFERERAKVLGGRFVAVTGKLQNEAGVIHVIADRIDDLTPMLGLLSEEGAQLSALANADEVRRPQEREKQSRAGPDLFGHAPPANDDRARREARAAAAAMPKGRNFH